MEPKCAATGMAVDGPAPMFAIARMARRRSSLQRRPKLSLKAILEANPCPLLLPPESTRFTFKIRIGRLAPQPRHCGWRRRLCTEPSLRPTVIMDYSPESPGEAVC